MEEHGEARAERLQAWWLDGSDWWCAVVGRARKARKNQERLAGGWMHQEDPKVGEEWRRGEGLDGTALLGSRVRLVI